jgi:hypothetical protein
MRSLWPSRLHRHSLWPSTQMVPFDMLAHEVVVFFLGLNVHACDRPIQSIRKLHADTLPVYDVAARARRSF